MTFPSAFRCLSLIALTALFAGSQGCSSAAGTSVRIELVPGDDLPAGAQIDEFELWWLGPTTGLRKLTVPRSGANPLATVVFEVDGSQTDLPAERLGRRLVVRALMTGNSTPVAYGSHVLTVVPHTQTTAQVAVSIAAPPDRDNDGVPDSLDICPDLRDFDQCDDGTSDAGVHPDASLDRAPDRPIDVRPDMGLDATVDKEPIDASIMVDVLVPIDILIVRDTLPVDITPPDMLPPATVAPVAPVDLMAVSKTPVEMVLTWKDASDDERDFEIQRLPNGRGTGWVKIATVPSTDILGKGAMGTYTDTLVTAGAHYGYRVRAINNINAALVNLPAAAISMPVFVTSLVGPNEIKLSGRLFSSEPSAGKEVDKVFDGNLSTYFESSATTASACHVGMDFGQSVKILRIRFASRATFASRMVGGRFEGSADGQTYAPILTLTVAPDNNKYVELPILIGTYRYLRYLGSAMSFCNIAEIESFGTSP